MKKRIIIPIIFLLISIVFVSVLSLNDIYAQDDKKDIIFSDANMYNAIKVGVKDQLHSEFTEGDYDDDSKTLKLTDEEIKKVKNLNLQNKGITDISGIENFTSLTNLDLMKNQISDISLLKDCQDITNLNLTQTTVSDISVLSNLKKLTVLRLCNNTNIDNIDVLENCTELTYLNLSWDSISDITVISRLDKLTELYLNGNKKISDISSLKNCKDLKKLYLYYNKISDISPLEGLVNLTELLLDNNKIGDITVLDKFPNLTNFTLNNNKITDNISSKIYKLPSIFTESQVEGSRVYTESDLECVNCRLSEDKQSVVIKDAIKANETATVKINGGVADTTTLILTPTEEYTKEPIATITYDNEDLTNKDVIATIKFDKENVIITNEDGSNTHTFTSNGTYTFKYKDETNGVTGSIDAIVNNIDKDAPVVESITTNYNKDGSVQVTLKINEKVKELEGWFLSEDKTTLTKAYEDGTQDKIKVYDLAGNETQVDIKAEATKNPFTGDMLIYSGLALLVAIAIFIISKKYIKISKN